jgi:hypothetical protein
MKTTTENVVCVYDDEKLVAILKRDDESGHKVIYMTTLADVEQITELINPDHTLI